LGGKHQCECGVRQHPRSIDLSGLAGFDGHAGQRRHGASAFDNDASRGFNPAANDDLDIHIPIDDPELNATGATGEVKIGKPDPESFTMARAISGFVVE
jgi:hypothetical protein